MAKKIIISLLVAIIFLYPMQVQNMQNADAAIASKVASLSAKKVAKEVIQDAAVETAANFALMQALEIVGDYEAKPGFKIVCPDGSQSCDKPIQVKENITDADKQAIKGQSGLELDKMINNGKAIPKWQKFLDWFLPVWLVTFGATVLTYALDSDVRSFFNETGYNALVALGLISPVSKNLTIDEQEKELDVKPDGSYKDKDGLITQPQNNVVVMEGNSSRSFDYYPAGAGSGQRGDAHNTLFITDITYTDSSVGTVQITGNWSDTSGYNYGFFGNNLYVATPYGADRTVVKINGQIVFDGVPTMGSNGASVSNPEIISIFQKKINSIRHRSPYKIGDNVYYDALYRTVSGDLIESQSVKKNGSMYRDVRSIGVSAIYNTSSPATMTHRVFKNISTVGNIIIPSYEEMEQNNNFPKSNYEDDKGRVAIIPPAAIPLEEEGTGQQVIRVPSANGDGYEFQKPDGTKVPEENVTTGPDPVVTPSPGGQTTPGGQPIPEGTPTVTPTPTPQAPNPEPIPLTPDQTAPPGDGTEPPVDPNPFPEGDTCDVGLKFPKFVPFFNTLSNAFPFSIPWDIERAFIAAFSDIGDERPSFELDIGIGDKKQIVKITTPAFFDDWKPFTDSLIRFIFAVGIMFGIYRFMKGGSS